MNKELWTLRVAVLLMAIALLTACSTPQPDYKVTGTPTTIDPNDLFGVVDECSEYTAENFELCFMEE